MKDIKFRFWSGSKMFYDVEEVMSCLTQQIAFNQNLKLPLPYDHVGQHGADFMMFTGLKDKNGKEIYEGDIVKQDTIIGTVVYQRFGFFVEWMQNERARITLGSPHPNSDNDFSTRCEVIGNIHQNPELMTK